MIMERRKVSYKEFDRAYKDKVHAEIGYCLLITGGMMSPAVAIVERPDGTMVELPISAVQFLDIPQWANLPENMVPHYGPNDGGIQARPNCTSDLHQYTSGGKA